MSKVHATRFVSNTQACDTLGPWLSHGPGNDKEFSMSKLKVHNVELGYLNAVAILWLIQIVPILALVVKIGITPTSSEVMLVSSSNLFFMNWVAMANAFVVSAAVWYAKGAYPQPKE